MGVVCNYYLGNLEVLMLLKEPETFEKRFRIIFFDSEEEFFIDDENYFYLD